MIDPKTLLPDVHAVLAAIERALAVLAITHRSPPRTELRRELQSAHETVTFIGAALGDPALTRTVCAWALPENAAAGLDGLLAGREMVRVVNALGRSAYVVRGRDGILRFVDDPNAPAIGHDEPERRA